jgi:hypothetical protein
LPATTVPPLASTPILIYGAGSTAGQYAIQLLSLAGYKNIISTASKKHHEYLQSLGATSTFDYNSPTLVDDIAKAAGGDGKVTLALDCITAETTLSIIGKVLSSAGTVAILLPVKEGNSVTAAPGGQMFTDIPKDKNPLPAGAKYVAISTFNYQEVGIDFYLYLKGIQLICLTIGHILERQLVIENPHAAVGVWYHQAEPRPFDGSGYAERPCSCRTGFA